ncbi:MAG: hypothetical protein WKF37_09435, partial [Bryobacteraceae bacterium]
DCAKFDASGNLISAGAPCAAASPVQLVFGRTGAITKVEGDYNLADLGDVQSKQGTTAIVQMSGGTAVNSNDCAKFDASGNLISAGAPCAAASPVQLVFGRTGAITKVEGDYNLADLGDVQSKQGTTAIVQMSGGTAVNSNDCAKFDASGNLISAGAPCAAASPVQLVFGRTGAITKVEGDYNLADLGDVQSKQGTTAIVQMSGGTAVNSNDCAKFDASGNLISAGAPCTVPSRGSFVADVATTGFTQVSGTTQSTIATSVIPANTLAIGDHIVIRAVFLHQGGTASTPRPTVSFGGTNLVFDGAVGSGDTFATFEAEVIVSGSAQQFGLARLQRSNSTILAPVRSAPVASIASDIPVVFSGRMTAANGEVIKV